MVATVRNRRGIVASVEPYDTPTEGRLHLVRVEYTDSDGAPEDVLLWERERNASLLEPTALPRVGDEPPMPPADFDALVRACRWSAVTPFHGHQAGETGSVRVAAPVFGAIQVEDFQLVPVLHALRTPRVSLLLADDVGLGKTIEAGLILTELLLHRRVRRVLILSPASLRQQWQQEMRDKFSLGFDVVDRDETHALQKRLGLDANPWRTFPRIIASYHYLKQPDVLERFRAACRQPEGSSLLPWDLLIVDEAHNLSPSNFGNDSDLCEMLRLISPWFEHKLFLTATPHNGHTRSFSGLLELLDPVRFTQTSEFTTAERKRVEEVVIRRLKREINEADSRAARTPRFAERFLEPIPLFFGQREQELSRAFVEFRRALRDAVADARRADQLAGTFAVEVLNKRLLSCPATFADSWYRFREGMAEAEPAAAAEMVAAHRASEEDLSDDGEKIGRGRQASRTAGAWLKPFADPLKSEITAIDNALHSLGIAPDDSGSVPRDDARWDRLIALIKHRLRQGNQWVAEERLIVFTEYKTTLDYVHARLKNEFHDDGRAIRALFGGEGCDRAGITAAFNDPSDPIRVLVATDAASEGMNLQESARLLLHYDIPWNPARLEQRNGRLDRHGQARDVTVFHFASNDDADLKFLAHVVSKVNAIRDDLGAVGEIFDAAFERRFSDQQNTDSVTSLLDAAVERARGRADLPHDAQLGADEVERLAEFCREIDLSPDTLRATLDVALGINFGRPRIDGPDARGRFRLRQPLPPQWTAIIDDALRTNRPGSQIGALPALAFDPSVFVSSLTGRPVFRPVKDTVLLHLGHPLFRQALAMFARSRFPGGAQGVSATRWTVRNGDVPRGSDALLLLTIEELAVNELREPFHHWVRTIRIPIRNGNLGEPLPPTSPSTDGGPDAVPDAQTISRAADLWLELAPDLPLLIDSTASQLTSRIQGELAQARGEALHNERERFRHRLKEVERAIQETTLAKLERERDRLLAEMRQTSLFPELARETEQELRNLEDELHRRRHHYEELLAHLRVEQARVIERLVPQRYTLRGSAQVFPIAVEIRLPPAGAAP